MAGQIGRRDILKFGGAGMLAAGASSCAATGADVASPQEADVIIIGAGFSGLAAARTLDKAGLSTIILEASDRAGGRVKPAMIADVAIDAGGMWLSTEHTSLRAIIRDAGLLTYPTFLDGNGTAFFHDGKRRFAGENAAEAFDESVLAPYGESYAAFLALQERVNLSAPHKTPDAGALDAITVGDWARRFSEDPVYLSAWDATVRTIICASSADASLLSFLFYCKSGGGLEALSSASEGGAQHMLVDGGMSQVVDHLVSALSGRIVYNQPAFSVSQDGSGITVETTGGTYRAAHLICTLPPALAGRLLYDPPVSALRDGLTQRAPLGSVIKFWLAYETPFWREAGLNGLVYSAQHTVSAYFDVSPPSTSLGLLSGFIDASASADWMTASPAARQAEALKLAVEAFGEKAGAPIDYIETIWPADPWARGCYGTYTPPGVLVRYGDAISAPEGRIHWAGTYTAPNWNGHIEGAIRSGVRAADDVRAAFIRAGAPS